ncbi:hypothetical protein [Niveibacterium sp.]|uniref:DUF7079 family protein n=1 Tax=Niveibacterium sp. TaxID=2017444 RepID=UPI0035B43E7B
MPVDAADASDLRAAVWINLAELFVARELQDYDYQAIARALKASDLSQEEIRRVLVDEVAPTFLRNLSSLNPMPAFDGWSADVVCTKVLAEQRAASGIFKRVLRFVRRDPLSNPILRARWQRLQPLLA